jgi:G:T/U-mismatch repair DNA glycosylase
MNKLHNTDMFSQNNSTEPQNMPLERHPWPPFLPNGARILILGTFPPGNHRWSMDFYYPNRTNDFWKICGLIFLNNPEALYDKANKCFKIDEIKALMAEKHIALHDTAKVVRRLKGNASDKHLEIIEPVKLFDLLKEIPECHTVATTGEKAASIIAELTNTKIPAKGEMISSAIGLEIWRMPSTSRAYPLPLEQKAEYYAKMFQHVGLI